MRNIPGPLLLLAVLVTAGACNKKSEPLTATYLEGEWEYLSKWELEEGIEGTEEGWMIFDKGGFLVDTDPASGSGSPEARRMSKVAHTAAAPPAGR